MVFFLLLKEIIALGSLSIPPFLKGMFKLVEERGGFLPALYIEGLTDGQVVVEV